MVVRLIIGRAHCPLVRPELIKKLAGGSQLVPIGVFAAVIVAPTFNSSLHPSQTYLTMGSLVASRIELLAQRLMGCMRLMRCICPADPGTEGDGA